VRSRQGYQCSDSGSGNTGYFSSVWTCATTVPDTMSERREAHGNPTALGINCLSSSLYYSTMQCDCIFLLRLIIDAGVPFQGVRLVICFQDFFRLRLLKIVYADCRLQSAVCICMHGLIPSLARLLSVFVPESCLESFQVKWRYLRQIPSPQRVWFGSGPKNRVAVDGI
jgi:hypothetical protein